jgi:NTE family protein
MISDFTLVLGGGGVWGTAWMTGLIAGFEEEGLRLRDASAVIGTSAGSVVAAQILGAETPAALYQRQVDPAMQPEERMPDPKELERLTSLLRQPWDDPHARIMAVAELAVRASTISMADRRGDLVKRLGPTVSSWPAKHLKITAVDVETGDLHVFDAGSGVELVDAIAASCAVPGVWPIVTLKGRRYIDGGIWRTGENAHLGHGAGSIVILSPFGRVSTPGAGSLSPLDRDIAQLRASGSKVTLIAADDASLATGASAPLSPATRTPAALAGHAQARRTSAELRISLS